MFGVGGHTGEAGGLLGEREDRTGAVSVSPALAMLNLRVQQVLSMGIKHHCNWDP